MKRHHLIAATTAAVNVVALLVDTVMLVVTGERTFITDDAQGSMATAVGMSLWLGLTFAAMAVVANREADRFVAAGPLARRTRPVLLVCLLALAAGFLTVGPAQLVAGVEEGLLYDLSGLVAMLALTGVFVASLVLGLAMLRRNRLGVGGRVLGALGPVILLTGVLALVAPSMTSPVYSTMVVLSGLALIGVPSRRGQARSQAAVASPTSAV